MTFKNIIIAVLLLFAIRPFIDGPFEPCFLITGVLSVIRLRKWLGNKRAAGGVILLISVFGLAHDLLERKADRDHIQNSYTHLLLSTNQSADGRPAP